MMHNEYPKILYGAGGWDDLSDHRIVMNAVEEDAARSDGYAELSPVIEAGETDDTEAAQSPEVAPVKRRGRPPLNRA